jgi:hypothetical protein
MAEKEYRARAAELFAQAKLEQDPEVAETLEVVAEGFQQLADSPPLAMEFEFPRQGLLLTDPYKK